MLGNLRLVSALFKISAYTPFVSSLFSELVDV